MPLDLGKARSFQRFDQFARAVLGQVEGTLDLVSAAKVYDNLVYALSINRLG